MDPVTTVRSLRPADAVVPGLERTPPHNDEAEMALLGAILHNNRAYERVADFLRPEHFANRVHGRIFEAIGKLIDRGQIADPITLKQYFEADADLAEIGGYAYLMRLAGSVASIVNAEDYGRTVHDLHLRRQLIALGEDMVNDAFRDDLDNEATTQIETAEQRLYTLASTGEIEAGLQEFSTALKASIEAANAAFRREGQLAGVPSGFTDLDKLLGGLHSSDLLILAGRPSMGKAQPLGAKVLTLEGWKTMGEMRPGDRLASVDGRPSMVSGVFPQGTRQIYRVTFSDGRSTECCAEHLWRVHYRDWPAPRILATAKLSEMLGRARYKGRLWIDTASGHFGTSEPLPIDPWVLGALLGDGTLAGGAIRFSTAEPEMLERLQARLGEGFALTAAGGYDHRIVTAGGHRRAGVQGVVPNQLKIALSALGLWDIPSERKFIPPRYLAASRGARLDLLRGLMDTDGWVEKWGSVRFCTSSAQLASDVVYLVRSLGGKCSIKSKRTSYSYAGERRVGLTAYVCNIQHEDPGSLMLLTHKRGRASTVRQRRKRLTIASIEPTRLAEAQCISVTHPDRLYVTDDFIVTHNTALATNIAFHAARTVEDIEANRNHIVAFFSLEMSAEQLATRILAEQTQIPSERIRRGELSNDDFERLVIVAQELERLPLYIDDTPALSIAALRTRARRLKRSPGLSMIVVDYLQLLHGSSTARNENRVQELSEITRGLKTVAKELDVPVLALSQLSRAVENRDDKRPQLSDLRESGSIEQDADVVMFVYRDEYYLARKEPREGTQEHVTWQEEMDKVHNLAEVIVAKQRHGPIGKVMLRFEGETTRFSNYVADDHLPDARY